MALEFNCPYCQATIRVPDHSAGKRGKCPKCASRISIPKWGATRRAEIEPPRFPVVPEPVLPQVEDDGDVIFDEYDPEGDVIIAPEVEAGLAPGDVALPRFPGEASSTLPRPVLHIPDSVMSRVKRRRRSGWIWMMLVCLLLGGGAAGLIFWYQSTTTLTGELTGQLVENSQLPPTFIPRTDIEMPPAELNKILHQLQHNPSTLVSSRGLATVQFQGSDRGLLVSISPGSATSLYRVQITDDKKLANYRRDQAAPFEQFRHDELSLAVNDYFRTIRKINAKQGSTGELRPFRDNVGIAASVRGLGYFLEAVHQRQIFPCVAEDDDAVYFLLPAGVKRFQIQGKSRKGAGQFFPGKFDVRVEGSIQLPDNAPEDLESEPSVDSAEDQPMEDDEAKVPEK